MSKIKAQLTLDDFLSMDAKLGNIKEKNHIGKLIKFADLRYYTGRRVILEQKSMKKNKKGDTNFKSSYQLVQVEDYIKNSDTYYKQKKNGEKVKMYDYDSVTCDNGLKTKGSVEEIHTGHGRHKTAFKPKELASEFYEYMAF